MVQEEDWRLLNEVDFLKERSIIPTDGAEIAEYAPYLKKCIFCWDKVQATLYQRWFIPEDKSCCICEKCYIDFKDMFHWKKLDGWDMDWTG